VCYGIFNFIISLIILKQSSPSHEIQAKSLGGFSSVYKARLFEQEIAIKCTCFTGKTFMKVFQDVLAEYLMFLVSSELEIAPKMTKTMGFDLIIYQDCIEFSMELCQDN
jgi:hypothetical protein